MDEKDLSYFDEDIIIDDAFKSTEEPEKKEEPTEEVEETTVEVVEEREEPEEKKKDEDEISDKDRYEALLEAKYLTLPSDYEFKDLDTALADSEKNRIEIAKQELLNSLPEKNKELYQYIIEGGEQVDEYKEYNQLKETVSSIKLTDDNQDDYYKDKLKLYYTLRGFDNEDIQDIIDNVEDTNKLEERGKKADKLLDKYITDVGNTLEQKKQQAIEDRNKAIADRKTALEAIVSSEADNISGYSITKKERERAVETLYEIKTGSKTTTFNQNLDLVLNDPELVVVLADIFNNIEKDDKGKHRFNFKNIKTEEKAKATKNLKSKLDMLTGGPKSSGDSKGKKASDWADFVV
jgi:hypothetical protein